jgi:hypothetical protein
MSSSRQLTARILLGKMPFVINVWSVQLSWGDYRVAPPFRQSGPGAVKIDRDSMVKVRQRLDVT